MRGACAIFLPVAFLLLLSSSQGSAEESLDGSNPSAEDSSAIPTLKLGKRSDHSATDDEEDFDLATSPEFLEYVSEHLYPFAHPSDQQFGEDDTVDDLVDDGEGYNSLFEDNIDDDGDEESLEQQLQFWRPDSTGSDKRQDERSNDQFTADGQWSSFPDIIGGDDVGMVKRQASPYQSPMSDLRLGKRPMKMLRLGKRPMKMLRLGKRPMKMLRLGKRQMKMLRLGKRQMKMLRLGKRPMKMLRLGKRPMKMLRLGKRPMKMLRLGKRPMKMLRLGKRPMKMLRLGKRSTEAEESLQSVASA